MIAILCAWKNIRYVGFIVTYFLIRSKSQIYIYKQLHKINQVQPSQSDAIVPCIVKDLLIELSGHFLVSLAHGGVSALSP